MLGCLQKPVGLFLFLLGLRCLFREYFRLRLYLFFSLGFLPLSARSHPDEQGSEDQAASQEVGAGTDLCAFPLVLWLWVGARMST